MSKSCEHFSAWCDPLRPAQSMVQAAARVSTLRDKYILHFLFDNHAAVTYILMSAMSAAMHCASQRVIAQ